MGHLGRQHLRQQPNRRLGCGQDWSGQKGNITKQKSGRDGWRAIAATRCHMLLASHRRPDLSLHVRPLHGRREDRMQVGGSTSVYLWALGGMQKAEEKEKEE